MKDFAPVGIGATLPMVVVVANKLPIDSINELIAYAKANPGKLSYASPGIGAPHHLATELFMDMTGTKMVMVPYKGASGMLADLISGEVHVMFGALNSALPLIQSGKIRAIGLAERQRLPLFKDMPTVKESLPGYEVNFWFGLLAPAGTPKAVVSRLNAEMVKILNLTEIRDRLSQVGFEAASSTPEEFASFIQTEIVKLGKVVKSSGAKLD